MAINESTSRVGRSQGASIFWGMVSVFFAAAACFYFWKSQENESSSSKLRDEVQNLQDKCDTLTAEKEKLQARMSDSAGQLKTREEFLDEKEAKLAAQEAKLEAGGVKPVKAPVQPPVSTATVPKKFADTIKKLALTDGADVITRGGRPVLRLPNTSFFAPGDATLKPDGQALLNQIAQSLSDVSDSFELRIESYTDVDAEAGATDPSAKTDKKKDPAAKTDVPSKSHFTNSWDLTAARATTIERYYRDQTPIAFQNVLVAARGDSQPISTAAHNRRVEISLAPLPAAFHSDASSLAPPPDAPAPPAKDKAKDKGADKPDKTDKSAAKSTDKDKNKDTGKSQ